MPSDAAPPPPLPAGPTPSPSGLPARGPGLIESIGWTIGYLCLQMVVAIGLIAVLVMFAFEGWPRQSGLVTDVLERMEAGDLAWLSVYVTGGATLLSLFVIAPAAFLRLRPQSRAQLGTHRPADRQLVLLAGAVLPLAILSDELYRAASSLTDSLRSQLAQWWPAIESLGRHDTIDLIQGQAAFTAYPLLLVIVGVGPAIGEELIFRGVIGRGLISRLGIIPGVLLTSLLFAVAHGTPAHAVATLPLAIFLHLAYLATRTIWAPILLHFLNNALSVSMLKYGLGQNVEVSMYLLVSAAIYVTAIGVLLWFTRDGRPVPVSRLNPALPSLRLATSGGEMTVASPHWLTYLATTGAIGFTWTFVVAAMAG